VGIRGRQHLTVRNRTRNRRVGPMGRVPCRPKNRENLAGDLVHDGPGSGRVAQAAILHVEQRRPSGSGSSCRHFGPEIALDRRSDLGGMPPRDEPGKRSSGASSAPGSDPSLIASAWTVTRRGRRSSRNPVMTGRYNPARLEPPGENLKIAQRSETARCGTSRSRTPGPCEGIGHRGRSQTIWCRTRTSRRAARRVPRSARPP